MYLIDFFLLLHHVIGVFDFHENVGAVEPPEVDAELSSLFEEVVKVLFFEGEVLRGGSGEVTQGGELIIFDWFESSDDFVGGDDFVGSHLVSHDGFEVFSGVWDAFAFHLLDTSI